MKRTILIIAAGLLALVAKAQEDTLAYHSFVQPGKTWQVHRLGIAASLRRTINYSFSGEDAVETINGKEYLRMHASWSDGKEEDRGLFREEGRKVYFYNEKNAKESLFYDFTLQTGDEFGHYKVVSTSYIVVNGEQLRTITLQEGEDKVTWIEGVGYQSGPLADSHGTTWSDCIAYVIGGDGVFFPFEIESHLNGLYGQPLVKRGEMDGEDINPEWTDMLQYELFPERGSGNLTLHVYGYMQVQCGPNNYVWCRVEGNKVSLQVVELEPLMDCKSWVKVDMYFPFFQEYVTYTTVDSRGEHVIQTVTDYRPFIEQGKVWKIGWIGSEPILHGDELRKAKSLEYYYFDGFVQIGNTWCSKLMRRDVNYSGEKTSYVAAIHENGKCVYYALPGEDEFRLLYDFSITSGDTISLSESFPFMIGSDLDISHLCTLVSRHAEETDTYKGVVLTIDPYADQPYRSKYEPVKWMTGVGCVGPYNMFSDEFNGGYTALMSCTVGEEVLFENNYWIDAVTNDPEEVKKQWLDFTHTVKPRPKSPRRRGSGSWIMESGQWTMDRSAQRAATASDSDSEESTILTGEYSDKDLLVSLVPLQGPYTVMLTDAGGKEVYVKTVQTSSVVALNTDLSKYPAGNYTLTVENADEAYTAQLNIGEGNGIKGIGQSDNLQFDKGHSSIFTPQPSIYYDLSGRRLSVPPARGIYIKDGQKAMK